VSIIRAAVLALLVASPAFAASPQSRFALEVEGGAVWQSRNDVEIPNDGTATRFSVVDVVGNGPFPAARLYFTWNISDRHGLRVLLAPLVISGTGQSDVPLDFAGESFAAGQPIDATYRFNSWRLSYRYRLFDSERWTGWIGFTAKIRDAEVRLEQGATVGKDTDVGFVPLLHLAADWRFSDGWRLSFDGDGLAGGPGRAFDASLKLVRDFDDRWSMAGGYRTVEGGADVDAVYNFAWLHYAVLSVTRRF
jgi:hypothetical protein